MPQLDIYSYATTILWTLNVFLGLIYYNYSMILPRIAQNAKLFVKLNFFLWVDTRSTIQNLLKKALNISTIKYVIKVGIVCSLTVIIGFFIPVFGVELIEFLYEIIKKYFSKE